MDYVRVKHYVELQLLRLDESLTYHNASHTLNDVLPAAERLAIMSNISDEDLTLLKTAVLFHDLGYLEQYQNNEPIGARMASGVLADYDYSEQQIKTIEQLILATRVPQAPQTSLQEIICDADLDSLGRDDFFDISMRLLAELNQHGQHIEKQDWYQAQINFLEKHAYFTLAAQAQRQPGKMENIRLLKQMFAQTHES